MAVTGNGKAKMCRVSVASLVCMWASLLLAGGSFQPLNIKTGLWQVTWNYTVSGHRSWPPDVLAGMSPEQRARVEEAMKTMASGVAKPRILRQCVTKEQLSKDPFSENPKSCSETVISSTGREMLIRGVCLENGVKGDMTARVEALDSENIKGSVQLIAAEGKNSMNTNASFTGKWMAPVCKGAE